MSREMIRLQFACNICNVLVIAYPFRQPLIKLWQVGSTKTRGKIRFGCTNGGRLAPRTGGEVGLRTLSRPLVVEPSRPL